MASADIIFKNTRSQNYDGSHSIIAMRHASPRQRTATRNLDATGLPERSLCLIQIALCGSNLGEGAKRACFAPFLIYMWWQWMC